MLKYSQPPLVLLLLSKHPRGRLDHALVPAVVSDQPICLAAASHVAASAIQPYPWSPHVPEVTMGYTVVCRPATLLHELFEASQKSPVAGVHAPAPPQKQGPGLAVAPSPCEQAGPVKEPTVKLFEVLHWLRLG